MKKILSVIVALLMVFTSLIGYLPVKAAENFDESKNSNHIADLYHKLSDIKYGNELDQDVRKNIETNLDKAAQLMSESQEKKRVIVQVEEPSILDVMARDGVKYEALSASTVDRIENSSLAMSSRVIEEMTNRGYLEENMLSVSNNYNGQVQDEIEIHTISFSGFVCEIQENQIQEVEKLPGVKQVFVSNEYQLPITFKPSMTTSNDMIGSDKVWNDFKYKGEGTKVAIIDSGIDYEHEAMKLTTSHKDMLTEAKVNGLIKANNMPGKYYSEKVPYGYNYFDNNYRIKDEGPAASEHGMHVSGIVSSNSDTLKGVAPEAQLFAMKVFGNDPIYPTTFSDIYIRAIEDAIILGADVINMSLGSPAGFDIKDDIMDKVFTKAVNAGIVCAVAAGNESHIYFGYKNQLGFSEEQPFAEDRDYGVTGTPSTYEDTFSVASVQNSHLKMQSLRYSDEKLEELPVGSYIIYDQAYSRDYLLKNEMKFKDLFNKAAEENKILYKQNKDTFFNILKEVVDKTELPLSVNYTDENETSKRSLFAMDENAGLIPMLISAGNPTGTHEYVVAGLGTPEEIPVEVKGKYALIQRGGMTFEEKVLNAIDKGAVGVILYNNAPGKFGAQGVEKGIPVVCIEETDGEILLNLDKKIVSFNGEVATTESPLKDRMSDFSSQGPTPMLHIKPEITAPGGDIYSTMNNNRYDNMSGTSMATPHIAGASALMAQFLKDEHPEFSAEKRARLSKVLLMNTAIPVKNEDGVNYSVRKQGAGLINIPMAIETPAYVTTNEQKMEAKYELKAMEHNYFSMPYTMTSLGKAANYKVKVVAVKDRISYFGKNTMETEAVNATVNGDTTVDLKENASVSGMLNIQVDVDKDDYVEGWVVFESETAPSLVIPFLGYYGDWAALRIFDDMVHEFTSGKNKSVYQTSIFVQQMPNGKLSLVNGDEIPFSTNESADVVGKNNVLPLFTLLRNADNVKAKITDMKDKPIVTIGDVNNIRKSYYNHGRGLPFAYVQDFIFTGVVGRSKDTLTGSIMNDMIKEGHYKYVLEATAAGDSRIQKKEIGLHVDNTDPKISDIEVDEENRKLRFTCLDDPDGVGILGFGVSMIRLQGETPNMDDRNDGLYVPGHSPELTILDEEAGRYEVDLSSLDEKMEEDKLVFKYDPTSAYKYLITALDLAGNTDIKSKDTEFKFEGKDKDAIIYLESPELISMNKESNVMFNGYVICDHPIEVKSIHDGDETKFRLTPDSKITRIGQNNQIEFENKAGYRFSERLSFTPGTHNVILQSQDKEGKIFNTVSRIVYVDTTPPVIGKTEYTQIPGTDKVTVTMNVKEQLPSFSIFANGSNVLNFEEDYSISTPTAYQGDVTFEVEGLPNGKSEITIEVIDAVGNRQNKFLPIDIAYEEVLDKTEALHLIDEFKALKDEDLNEFGKSYKELALKSESRVKGEISKKDLENIVTALKAMKLATITKAEEEALEITLDEKAAYSSIGSLPVVKISPKVKGFDGITKYFVGKSGFVDFEKLKDLGEESILNGEPKRTTLTFLTDKELIVAEKTLDLNYEQVEPVETLSLQLFSTSKKVGEKISFVAKVFRNGKPALGKTINYMIKNSKEEKVYSGKGETNDTGSVLVTYDIPADASTGTWTVIATYGSKTDSKTFVVKPAK